jgi:phage terminase large subunit-like protein
MPVARKVTRAEPVSALYEQGKVHHVGSFPALEDQMVTFTADRAGDTADDRVDALVWALSELCVTREPYSGLLEHYRQQAAAAVSEAATGVS